MVTVPITKPITIITESKVETSTVHTSVEYLGLEDLGESKSVTCFFRVGNQRRRIVLWEGAAYDAAGQYTDTDVQARLAELLNA